MTDDVLLYDIDSYLQKTRQWATKNHFSAYTLAKSCNVAAGTLQKMFSKEWNPTVGTLRSIEKFMYVHDKDTPDFGVNLE